MQYLNFIVFFFLVSVAFFNRVATRSWVSPASIFSVFWTLLFFVAIFLVPYELQTLSLMLLAVFVVSFSFPSWFVARIPRAQSPENIHSVKSQPRVFASMLAVTSAMLSLHFFIQGFSLIEFFRDPARVAGQMLTLRYTGELSSNLFTALMYPAMYGLSALGGRQAALDRVRSPYFYFFLSLTPPSSLVIFQSSKGALVVSIFIFVGAFLASRKSWGERLTIFNNQNLLLATALILAFGFSFYSRGLSDSSIDYVVWKLKSYFVSYSVGSVFGFSDWFAFYVGDESYNRFTDAVANAGKYTFYPLVPQEITGPNVPAELYVDYATWGTFVKTNIYTFYRGLILDFGVFGALILMTIFGSVFHLGYLELRCNHGSISGWTLYVFFFVFCYQSYIASPFNYLSYYVFAILLVLFGFINRLRI